MTTIATMRPLQTPFSSTGFMMDHLAEVMHLGGNAQISFHWADFAQTCDMYQSQMAINPKLRQDFDSRLNEMNKLKTLSVWIRNSNGVTAHHSLYSVYHDFILSSGKGGDLQPAIPQEISFISPSGPYKRMCVSECFNAQTYQNFVLIMLLSGKLPRRDFRLRMQSKLLVEFGAGYSEVGLFDLVQLTTKGILLKCSARTVFDLLKPLGHYRIMLSTSFLDETVKMASSWAAVKTQTQLWNKNPFYTHNKQEGIVLHHDDLKFSTRFDFEQTQDVYFFLSYASIAKSNSLHAKRLERFALCMRDIVKSVLQQKAA